MGHQSTFAPRRFDTDGRGLDTLLYLPEGYFGGADEQWPLVFFLHSEEARGGEVEQLKTQELPQVILESERFPFVAICPQCPEGQDFEEFEAELFGVLDGAAAELQIDPRAVLLTGVGMGAAAAWKLAAAQPKRFAALAPISGDVGAAEWSRRLAHLATWVFHGEEDTVAPPEGPLRFVERLRAQGAPVRVTLFPEAGHEEAWRPAYEDPALFEWFLRQTVICH